MYNTCFMKPQSEATALPPTLGSLGYNCSESKYLQYTMTTIFIDNFKLKISKDS